MAYSRGRLACAKKRNLETGVFRLQRLQECEVIAFEVLRIREWGVISLETRRRKLPLSAGCRHCNAEAGFRSPAKAGTGFAYSPKAIGL